MLWVQAVVAQELYVSKQGRDSNPGTKGLPFASLEKAKAVAAKYKSGVTVHIMQGTYYLAQPLVFSKTDSRNAGADLTFTAYKNDQVTIKGSRLWRLTFKPWRDRIWQAAIPAGSPLPDQLYVNGHLQVMARYPNYQPNTKPLQGTAADAISAARVRTWATPAGGYIHALHGSEWGGMHYRITGKSTDSTLQWEGGWQNNRPSPMHKQFRYVENILEELDEAGEWYADSIKRILYYQPPKGLDLHKAIIEVPVLENLVSFKGVPGQPVKNIHFKGLRFEHTVRTFMKNREPLLRSDWTIHRSGAVFFEQAENCSLESCDLFDLGGNAVFFSNYNVADYVYDCHIARVGAGGISFVGNPAAVRSPAFRYEQFVPFDQMDQTPGPSGVDFPAQCLVSDNLIHDIGLVEKQVAGVQLSMCQSIDVYHNTIYNLPRAGINVSEGTWGGHDISFNEVFNTVQETGDHGAFNSWGRDRYWHPRRATMDSLMAVHPDLWQLDAVLPTLLHDNRFRCDNGWDIDLDDGSSNYYIYNNVCLNGGLKLREGFHRVVKNNVIVNNSFHPHVWFLHSRDTFMHNIVSGPYLPIRINDWGAGVDSNFFLDQAALHTTRQWKVDQHSVAGDPHFEHAAQGNFAITYPSLAWDQGIRPVSNEFGVRTARLRAKAMKVTLPQLVNTTSDASATHHFLDMKVKNLNTLAERSATGMDRETGVLVLEVPASSPWHQQLQANDVILGLGGEPVNNVQDLLNAKMKVQWHATAVVIIFRDQKRQEMKLPLK